MIAEARQPAQRANALAILPSLVTFASTVCGLVAMWVAYASHTRTFIFWLLASGACDASDGPLARRLGVVSRFGNIYDSMSDLIAFGVAPSVSLLVLGLVPPWAALLYIAAIQFRLTRYSAMPEEEAARRRWFQGMPAPDAVYLTIALGMLTGSYTLALVVIAALAIFPGSLWPRGLRIPKILVAACVAILFARR